MKQYMIIPNPLVSQDTPMILAAKHILEDQGMTKPMSLIESDTHMKQLIEMYGEQLDDLIVKVPHIDLHEPYGR